MSGADLILYRRMRGIFWGLLVIGVVGLSTALVLGITIPSQLELYSSDVIDEVGRPGEVMAAGFALAGVVASIGAVVLGATAGSVDLQRGVLRDLVLAGRSRLRIVLGRLVAATVWLLLALAVSFAITIAVAMTLAPVDADPDWARIAREGAQYLPGIAYTLPFAAGVAMLVGSRGPAIAVFFVVSLIIDNVLVAIPKVGEWWEEVSLTQADLQVSDWVRDAGGSFDRPDWQAAVVLVGWAVIPFTLGVVRLTRRDL